MLFNGSRLIGCPVLSLHVGGQIASITELIVDPDDLKIIACRVVGPLIGKEVGEILPMESVREFSRLGMIVDSADEFVEPDEIIRIKKVLDLNFHLVGLKVESKQGAKLGKVSDFTLEPSTWQVQQLIVQRPLIKAFIDPELTISRNRIDEVNDYKVIIKEEKETPKSKAKVAKNDFVPSFVNPFREPDFAAETRTKNHEQE